MPATSSMAPTALSGIATNSAAALPATKRRDQQDGTEEDGCQTGARPEAMLRRDGAGAVAHRHGTEGCEQQIRRPGSQGEVPRRRAIGPVRIKVVANGSGDDEGVR